MLKSADSVRLGTTKAAGCCIQPPVALSTVNLRHRSAKGFSGLAIVCLALVLLSTTVQATHFCGLRVPDAQSDSESWIGLLPAARSCLICLMAPSISALILLVAFFTMSASAEFVGRLQMRPKPVLYSFRLYIRPPPFSLA